MTVLEGHVTASNTKQTYHNVQNKLQPLKSNEVAASGKREQSNQFFNSETNILPLQTDFVPRDMGDDVMSLKEIKVAHLTHQTRTDPKLVQKQPSVSKSGEQKGSIRENIKSISLLKTLLEKLSRNLKRKRRQILGMKKKEWDQKSLESKNQNETVLNTSVPTTSSYTAPVPDNLKYLNQQENDVPKVLVPVYTIVADVGVAFQKYLSPDTFQDNVDGNARSLSLELLTVDGNRLFDTSWIKFDQSNLKLYGFPLSGNQNKHVLYLKATNSRGKFTIQRIIVIVFALPPVFNHYLQICTTLTLSTYAGSVERRLRLAKAIANFIFPGLRTSNVWIRKFKEGCFSVTFRHLPAEGKCNFAAIDKIEKKTQNKEKVNKAFQLALKSITKVKSVKLTILGKCKKPNRMNVEEDLEWLRTVAPISILLAVVGVPTVISCIVGREVRKRQAMMRQMQDKRMKEDREQMLIQAAQYKHECGFDSDSERGGECKQFRPCRQQLDEDGKKYFGFSRIADIIIPEVVIDRVKQGTEILNTFIPQEAYELAANDAIEAAQRQLSVVQTLNPTHRLLDMSQEEKVKNTIPTSGDHDVEKKLKRLISFLKNPLEITTIVTSAERDETSAVGQGSYEARRKLSRPADIPMDTFLPNITSVFKMTESGARRNSLLDMKDAITESIRNKLGFILNTTFVSNEATDLEWQCAESDDEDINRVQVHRDPIYHRDSLTIERSRDFPGDDERPNLSERIQKSAGMYLDQSAVPGLMPCFGARVRRNENLGYIGDMKSRKRPRTQSVCSSENDGKRRDSSSSIFDRILHQSKTGVEKIGEWMERKENWRPEEQTERISLEHQIKKRNDCNPTGQRFRHDFATSSLRKCKHLKNMSISPRLVKPNDAATTKTQMQHCNYQISNNPIQPSSNTALSNNSQKSHKVFHEGSCNAKPAARRRKMLESNDHCYVNMVKGQLGEGMSTTAMSDNRLADVENWSWKRNANEEDAVETSVIESYEFSDDEHDEQWCGKCKADNDISKGLRHLDPRSGSWYPAYTSLKTILPETAMFSLLGGFRRNEPDFINRKASIQNATSNQENLRWFSLNQGDINNPKDNVRATRGDGLSFRQDIADEETISQWQESQEHLQKDLVRNQYIGGGADNDLVNMEFKAHSDRGIWTEEPNDYDGEDDFYDSMDEIDKVIYQQQSQNFGSYQYSYAPEYPAREFLSEEENEEHRSNYQGFHLTQMEPESDDAYDQERSYQDINPYDGNGEDLAWAQSFECSKEEFEGNNLHQERRESRDMRVHNLEIHNNIEGTASKDAKSGYCSETRKASRDESKITSRRRSLTDSEIVLPNPIQPKVSPTRSEPDSSARSNQAANTRKERRRSFLERQKRVEIPEKPGQQENQKAVPKLHTNPLFVLEDEQGQSSERFDYATVSRMDKARGNSSQGAPRTRKLTYSGPFTTAPIEAERIRQQDADIIEHQTKNYLRRQSLQHVTAIGPPHAPVLSETEPIMIQSRAKREDPQKRVGMRRFSTPSMESWTSTPEKYYYDATGDNHISEEDLKGAMGGKDKEKQPMTFGRGRAREYTQRLLKGVSPKIRRHSTSVVGQNMAQSQTTNATANQGTFLGKIGEGKFVQTLQTKLGRKESRCEETKSQICNTKERVIEEEKTTKGSPLTAIRNTFYLLSGGK